jgi:HlyD family secretion protein
MPDSIKDRARSSLNRHGLLGLGIAFVLFAGLGAWSATTEIAGAVVAQGIVVTERGAQRVQHPEGGIVAEILVENGDVVTAGQLLLRLDDTAVRASLAVVEAQLDDALARRARLLAESDGSGEMTTPSAPGWKPGTDFAPLFEQQQRLMRSRAASLAGQQGQLEEQTQQVRQQIAGLTAQRAALARQLAVLEEEWEGLSALLAEGLTDAARANANKNQRAAIEGEIARIDADVAAARASIAERGVVASQLIDDFQARVLEDLQQVNVTIAELLQQKIAAEDRLARLEVRAPQAGVVHESKIQTVGGVVADSETLMLIVPESGEVLVDARISPLDVDKIYNGQAVALRFLGLDARMIPDIAATVRSISPATSVDAGTGASYYNVRVAVPEDQLALLPGETRLVPGMPSEVFIETGNRTVLSYLMKPLTDHLAHTFRED